MRSMPKRRGSVLRRETIVLVLLECPAVSLAVTFPVITASGFAVGSFSLVLLLVLAPALVDSADGPVSVSRAMVMPSDLFSHKENTLKSELHA